MESDRQGQDELLLLSDLAKRIPYRPSYKTVWRWASHGMIRNGVTVKLSVVTLPSGKASTMAKYQEFLAELSRAEETRE